MLGGIGQYQLSKFLVLSEVVGRVVRGAKRSVLRHASALHCVSVVVHQVAILARVEYLSRARILLADIARRLQPPEVEQDGLVQLVVDDREAQVLQVFVELCFGYGVAPGGSIELLNGEDSFLHFLPDVLVVLAAVLDVGVIAKVEALLDPAEVGGLLGELDLVPESVAVLLPVLGHFAPEHEYELGKTY